MNCKTNRKFVLIAHCLLNPCAKVLGASNDKSAQTLVLEYLKEGVGIIQLPCVEMDVCGIMRWGHVKDQFDYPLFRRRCRELLEPVVSQVSDYLKHGFECVGIVGVDGSPTCGVNVTVKGPWCGDFVEENPYEERIKSAVMAEEKGIMIEELMAMLKERNIQVPVEAVKETSLQ